MQDKITTKIGNKSFEMVEQLNIWEHPKQIMIAFVKN